MSSINVNAASTQGLFAFFEKIRGQQQAAPSSGAGATVQPDGAGQGVQGAGHHHHHGNGAMFKQVEAAVTDALNSAQSDGTTDPNKVIEDAIAKVFQNAGSTPQAPGGAPGTQGADPDGDGDTDAAGQADNDGSTRQAFFQMLQQHGIDPKQFRADLMAAIKDARGGQFDPSTAFKSFPPGSTVDTNA